MKIGIVGGSFFDSGLEQGVICEKIKKIGYDGFDFSLCGDWRTPRPIYSKQASEWRKAFSDTAKIIHDAGLEVLQTHATFATDFIEVGKFSQECLDQFEKEIEPSAIMGSKYIVIHPINIAISNTKKEQDFNINMEMYSKLIPILQKYDIKCCVENMFIFNTPEKKFDATGCSTIEDMIKYIDSLNSDRFVACLDTGHMNMLGISPAEAARKLGNRLEVLHCHDNFALHDDHSAIGVGIIDWVDFAKALKDIDYKGAFSTEVIASPLKRINIDLMFKYAEFNYHCAKAVVDMIK